MISNHPLPFCLYPHTPFTMTGNIKGREIYNLRNSTAITESESASYSVLSPNLLRSTPKRNLADSL